MYVVPTLGSQLPVPGGCGAQVSSRGDMRDTKVAGVMVTMLKTGMSDLQCYVKEC